MSRQWKRKASLVVAGAAEGLDLSELKFTFRTRAWELQSPGSIQVRIFNLSPDTANRIQGEFTRLILQCGYEDGEFGSVFDGLIVQVRKGRLNAVDSYVDITASDGDLGYVWGIVNGTLSKGSSFKDRVGAITKAMGLQEGSIDLPTGQTLPRGVTMFGMGRDYLRSEAFSSDRRWWIQDGKIQMVPLDGYLPTEAVTLNSRTGMIGFPEQQPDGIRVRCLLNPRIKVGGRLQIDNASVQQAQLRLEVTEGATTTNSFLPSVADDGFYRAVIVEHEGDNRGQAWWTDIIAVGIDQAPTPSLRFRGYT